MFLIKLAWKNMWRNRSRTFITMAAIFFAVILSVLAGSLRQGIFDNLVKNVVSFYTGYIQVHRQGYQEEQILDNCFEASAPTEQAILREKNIRGISPRLESFALASFDDITRGCMVAGILAEKENQITQLRNKLIRGEYLADDDQAVLLAQGLAESLQLQLNDTLILIGQGYHGSTAAGKFRVKGILKFGSPGLNDRILFMPLPLAREFYSADGMITSYVLSLEKTKDLTNTAASVRSTLGDEYEVLTWKDIIPDIRQHIEADTNNSKYIQGVLYLLVCFGIFGTLLMMMSERKFEMGMLVAIGLRKGKLMMLLLFESLITVFTGCLMGIAASIPLVYYFSRYPLRIGGETARAYERFGFEPIFPTSTDPSGFIRQGLIVLLIGLLLSLYPMYKALRLDPVNAMKR